MAAVKMLEAEDRLLDTSLLAPGSSVFEGATTDTPLLIFWMSGAFILLPVR